MLSITLYHWSKLGRKCVMGFAIIFLCGLLLNSGADGTLGRHTRGMGTSWDGGCFTAFAILLAAAVGIFADYVAVVPSSDYVTVAVADNAVTVGKTSESCDVEPPFDSKAV